MNTVRASDGALGLLVVVLVAFAPLAGAVSSGEPVPPRPTLGQFTAQADEAGRTDAVDSRAEVQDLPAGLPPDLTVREPEDLSPLALDVLGETGARRLLRILDGEGPTLAASAVTDEDGVVYPYRYPAMTRLLGTVPAARASELTALGAGLVALSLRQEPSARPNAAAAAFAVSDRARSAGDCAAQLNVVLLVAAEEEADDRTVDMESDRAARQCPSSDPTARWLQGQYWSLQPIFDIHGQSLDDPVFRRSQRRANAIFDELVEQFPRSSGAWSGAADNWLRLARRQARTQPFTARHNFERALAAYRLSDRLSGRADTEPGQARALVGLRDPDRAVDLLEGTAEGRSPSARLQALLEAQEEARRFRAAERTARRLADLGAAGFPDMPPAFPVPYGDPTGLEPIGTDRLAALVAVRLQPPPGGGGNGAVVLDASFVPPYREEYGVTGASPGCPAWSWRRDAVLAGRAAAALEDWPTGGRFASTRPGAYCPPGDTLRVVARAESGQNLRQGDDETADLADTRQNLWRWGGDLRRADAVIAEWAEAAPDGHARPVQRLAEVRFLQRRYDDAASLFGRAARLFRAGQWDDDLDVWEAMLQRGGSLLRAGRTAEALPLLRGLEADAARGASYQGSQYNLESQGRFALVAYHARALLADAEREAGNLRAAAEDYAAAREFVPLLASVVPTGFRPARVNNNEAVALAALGRGRAALHRAREAVAADPMSPVFLLTAAVAAERAGDPEAAMDYNRRALDADPATFPAANDLGVALARRGDDAAAADAFRRAVGAAEDYALGWFNLGVVQTRRGPAYVVSAQGALARAFALDPGLADRARTPTPDETTYRTGLDLSRPLPPRWSFDRLQQVSPAASAGLLAVIMLGLGLARSTGRGRGAELAGTWLEATTRRLERVRLLQRARRARWGVAVTVLVFLIPVLRQRSLPLTDILVGASGVLVIALAAVRARAVYAARHRLRADQESWAPAMVFGTAAAVVGAPWAPLPVVRAQDAGGEATADGEADPTRGSGVGTPPEPVDRTSSAVPSPESPGNSAVTLHAVAPLTLGALALVLFLEAAWLHVPLARSWAIAALIMTASTLVPVKPLDGARLGTAGVVGSVGILAGALFVVLGLL